MKALVCSGGGSKTAWSAGVIQYLLGTLQINYDILAGVSAGALNCSYLSQFKHGEEVLAANMIKDLWSNMTTSKIFKSWHPFGKLHVPWRLSFYDSSPLHNLIKENIKLDKIRASGKKISVGAISITSGKYHTFDETDDDFIEAIMASSAVPGMMCPINMRDQLWVDGGTQELSPIRIAIEQGADEIDVITTSPEVRIKKFIEKPSVIDIVKRTLDLATDKILQNDLDKAFMYNKLAEAGVSGKKPIKFRILRPHNNLMDDLLDFRPDKIRELMRKGFQDGKTKYII